MNKLIQDIRQKPEPVRQKWVVGLATAGTFLAFLIWLASLSAGSPAPVSNDTVSPVPLSEISDIETLKSPFALGLETVGDQFQAVGDGWQILVKKVKLMIE